MGRACFGWVGRSTANQQFFMVGLVRIFFFGKEGNTTNKSLIFLIFLSSIKYQMIYRILIILYRYTYHIEKFDRYAALSISMHIGSEEQRLDAHADQCLYYFCWLFASSLMKEDHMANLIQNIFVSPYPTLFLRYGSVGRKIFFF